MNKAKGTKERLLETAVKIFALHGYEGSTTRMISNEARTNISAISYYFDGKYGLYQAAIEMLFKQMKQTILYNNEKVNLLLECESYVSQEQYRDALHRFITNIATFMLGDQFSSYAISVFLREQAYPSATSDRFYNDMMRPIHTMIASLVAKLTNRDAKSDDVIISTHAILGQIIIFRTHKELLLRRLDWPEYTPQSIDQILAIILKQADEIIRCATV